MNKLYHYNRELFIDNLKCELQKKNIKAQDLANLGIAPQPRISECLNKTKKANFTFEQIVMIASYLNISIDNLVGLSSQINNDLTLFDIFEPLLKIDSIEALSIDYIEREPSMLPILSFNHEAINAFLEEWKEMKSVFKNPVASRTLYSAWRKDFTNRCSQHYKKWGYRTELDYSRELSKELLNDFTYKYTRKLKRYTPEGIHLIKKHILELNDENFEIDLEKLKSALNYVEELLNDK